MSVMYCHDCDLFIDTDYDVEHFADFRGEWRCVESLTDEEQEELERGDEPGAAELLAHDPGYFEWLAMIEQTRGIEDEIPSETVN